MSEASAEGRELLASGDIAGLLRLLRAHGDGLPAGEVARLVEGAARLAGFGDLERAAAVTESERRYGVASAQALYDFGYACTAHDVPWLAGK